MNSEQDQQKNLIDTTDCLEAMGVFRCWKNFLFVVLILCLLLSQASFWLVNSGLIAAGQGDGDKTAVAAAGVIERVAGTAAKAEDVSSRGEEYIKKAAEQVADACEPNKPAAEQLQSKLAKIHIKVEFKHLALLIGFVNFVLVFAAILYCLTMMFSLKVSLHGRLGGINHISRAFFLSLVFLVLLLPWQIPWHRFFAGELFGAMYTAGDLLSSFTAFKDRGLLYKVLYYFRFTGYWLLAVLLLVLSQVRGARWSKTVLRRLEVM